MVPIFKNISTAMYASKRLGWIALGLYIKHMSQPAPENPYYRTLLEYHRGMQTGSNLFSLMIEDAVDYRMAFFPEELEKRCDAIDGSWGSFWDKGKKKQLILRRATRARLELQLSELLRK